MQNTEHDERFNRMHWHEGEADFLGVESFYAPTRGEPREVLGTGFWDLYLSMGRAKHGEAWATYALEAMKR